MYVCTYVMYVYVCVYTYRSKSVHTKIYEQRTVLMGRWTLLWGRWAVIMTRDLRDHGVRTPAGTVHWTQRDGYYLEFLSKLLDFWSCGYPGAGCLSSIMGKTSNFCTTTCHRTTKKWEKITDIRRKKGKKKKGKNGKNQILAWKISHILYLVPHIILVLVHGPRTATDKTCVYVCSRSYISVRL